MKRISMFVVVMTFFFFSALIADARGRGGFGGVSRTTIVEKKEVVFSISSQQFRDVMEKFSKKHPGYKCEEWSYDFDEQRYSIDCEKKKEGISINLLMDGSIKIYKWNANGAESVGEKIGIWQ